MHVARVGLTPVKGCRHRTQDEVLLAATGPRWDRVFCLVDPRTDRCLRTVDHPSLLQAVASWDGTALSLDVPGDVLVGEPGPTGDVREVDYWGRAVRVERVAGPWGEALSDHLGREVSLAATAPGEVVYGAAVSVVTRGSLAQLGSEVGAPVDGARFRATLELDRTGGGPAGEEHWAGRRLRVGSAEVRVRGPVSRCAVVDLDPATGVRDLAVLRTLARRAPEAAGAPFGVDAEVTRPGWVRSGDPAELLED